MGGQELMERREALGLEAMWGTQDPWVQLDRQVGDLDTSLP